ncbi:MAG: carbohydrate porin [Nitrospirae bacterium]|nr:carbohydrate porin [Nitrospirota bacterium]
MASKRRFMLNILAATSAAVLFSSTFMYSTVLAHDGEEDSDHQGEILLAREGEDSVTRPATEEHHEVGAELGHKLHPIHSDNQARISGWLTAIAQGTLGSKDVSGRKNDMAEGSLSGDIFYEARLDGSDDFMLHIDIQQGEGLVNTPALFASPNGNVTGPNNDVESFLGDQVHLAEAWYETKFVNDTLTLTLGQLDPTVYFDTNNYANNERFQFIANQFGNNTTIEFGGTGNFYGAGFRLTYSPMDLIEITVGGLDGDGDYKEMFDRPFVIAEVDLKPKLAGKEGNYRFYVWQNSLPHYRLDGDGNTSFVTTVGNPSVNLPTVLIGDKNSGFGISLDQVLTDNLGLWARLGIQDGNVSQFDRHVSGGIQLSGGAFGRKDDVIGVGVGYTLISDTYKKASGLNGNELYAEAYYNIAVKEGFYVTPDIQYIANPGGDDNRDSFAVYGARAGVMF